MTRLGVVLSVSLIIALWAGPRVSAQYPSPADTAVVSVSNPTPGINTTVTITWRIQGPRGSLPPAESPQRHVFAISLQTPPTGAQSCAPSIVSQPGSDARLTVRTNVPDPNVGMADLFTGATPGSIVVRINCPQGPSADITVLVQGATPTAAATLSPTSPASTTDRSSTPRPPSTGFGGQAGGSSATAAIALGAAAVAAAAAALAVRRLLRRERRNG